MALTTAGGSGRVTSPTPRSDHTSVGMGVGERLLPPPDLGEQIGRAEVQVVLVDSGHGASAV